MDNYSKMVAEYLLQIKAIKLEPSNPFTWASGWKSPIYCDNRKTLSFPEVRNYIREVFAQKIKENYPDVEVIAGVATGAIAIGILVADALDLPFIYVRSTAKGHGLGNKIEGSYKEGQKVVVIEDLISTGGSSLSAVVALREANCKVMGMLAIFTYGFQKSVDAFENAACRLETLSDYDTLAELAVEKGYINPEQLNTLKEWRTDPSIWGK